MPYRLLLVLVKQMIYNEKELITKVKETYMVHCLNGVE